MEWHAYALYPIDYGWPFLHTVTEAMNKVGQGEDFEEGTDYVAIMAFVRRFDSAQEAAVGIGWHGDFREEARVFWLPSGYGTMFTSAFVWKQDDHGISFVISPHPLPFLQAFACISYSVVDVPIRHGNPSDDF
jgi:hypothetical protein